MPQVPSGRELAPVLLRLWKEQEAALRWAFARYGLEGWRKVDLSRWQKPLIDRIAPFFERWYLQGTVSDLSQRPKKKHFVKRGAAATLINPFGIDPSPQPPDVPEHADWFEVFDPNVAAFARQQAFFFAQSTIATTQLRVETAYDKLRETLAAELEAGHGLKKLTEAVLAIFQDTDRAFSIAATESSRAYHGGQFVSAKESGEVYGKSFLASSDACKLCLSLMRMGPIPLDQPFIRGSGPYGTVMYPPAHPMCFCSLIWELSPVKSDANFNSNIAA